MPSSCTSNWRTDAPGFAALLLACTAAWPCGAANHDVNPANYQGVVASSMPGDTVNLAPGTYPRLGLSGLNGAAGARIVIQGPAAGAPAIVTIDPNNPDCCNIVQLGNTSYLTLRNLTVDSAVQSEIDFHVNRLVTGSTRGEVMLGFSESREYTDTRAFIPVYVTNMYAGMLRRVPEQSGFDYWVAYMTGGNSGQALIAGFLNAPEYHNRFLP